MRTMLLGLNSWMKMSPARGEGVRLVDGSITVVVTLLVVVTWTMLR